MSQHEQIQHAMHAWQQDIQAGNFAFDHGNFRAANHRYMAGLNSLHTIQQQVFGDENPPLAWIADQYVPALVVSYLNIVDCCVAQNDPDLACDYLVEGHVQLHSCAFGLAAKQCDSDGICLCEHISQLNHQTYLFAQRHAGRPELIAKINHAMQIEPMSEQTIH